MLTFPNINPVAFTLGPLKVHWYGIMYLLSFALAWGAALWRTKRYHLDWNADQISDLIFYAALGVIFGGRIGYMVFYNTSQLFAEPLSLFKIWQGGMSFHGGMLGVACALGIFAIKSKKSFLELTDFTVPLVPLGLALGRIGNFINGELWGRIAINLPWAMIFPQADNHPRHPSQLYEFILEGLLLLISIWWYAAKPRARGKITAIFLIGYALCRIIVEFFREPDPQLGFLLLNNPLIGGLTMGQLLSIPMLIGGLWLFLMPPNHVPPQ